MTILMIGAIFCCNVLAQEASFLDQYVNLKNEKDSIEKVLKSKETLIGLLNDTIKQKSKEIESLQASLSEVSGRDKNLDDSIKRLSAQLSALMADKERFDDVRLKYANGRLQLPYDKKKADEALKLFNEIGNQEMRTEYIDLPTCFRDYPRAIEMVRATMVELEGSREGFTKFTNEKWQSKAKEILQGDAYTGTYAKNYRNGVSIYYLDDIISEAALRISKSTDPRLISFQDLILKLNP